MKPVVRKSITHLVCIAVGMGAAMAFGRMIADHLPSGMTGGHGDDVSKSGGDPGNAAARKSKASKDRSDSGALRSKDFREAWDSIAKRNLTPHQRMRLQKELLKEWSMIDMEAAMMAALESNWDGGLREGGIPALIPAFREAFAKNPLEAWKIIQSGRLGVGASLFRWEWVSTVSKGDPMLVLSYFGEFSTGLKKAALGPLLNDHKDDPAVKAAILKLLGQMPVDDNTKSIALEYFKLTPPSGTREELIAKVTAAATDFERMMAVQELARLMRGADMETIKGSWSGLPADARNEILWSLIGSSQAKASPTDFLNLAIQAGNWDILRTERVAGTEGLVAEYAKRVDPISIAEWGLSLPERPETIDIFRRSITGYIDKNPVEAREWIMSIPEGDWRRERALLEYSQNSLWYKNNPEASLWAINQIKDPKVKGTAAVWRDEWAQRTGKK